MTFDQAKEIVAKLKGKPPAKLDFVMLGEALLVIAEFSFANYKGVSMIGVAGAPDWLSYETSLWNLSEEVRKFLEGSHDADANVLPEYLSRIIGDGRLGKGRQNFVLMLGKFGNAKYGPNLIKLLSDVSVRGHAIKALTELRLAAPAETLQQIIKTDRTPWIRKAASRNLELGKLIQVEPIQ